MAKMFAIGLLVSSILILAPTVFLFGGSPQKQGGTVGVAPPNSLGTPYYSQAVAFAETPALRDIPRRTISPDEVEQAILKNGEREKNERNTYRVKPEPVSKAASFIDPALNNFKYGDVQPDTVTNPIQNFDGPDMDTGSALFGGRFAPPDTNAAVGPNHVIAITNGGFTVYNKTGTVLVPQSKLSTLLVGIPNAADDDGDPVVLYDQLADRWFLLQFNLRFNGSGQMHMHVAVSKTGDPTGQYFAYDFLTLANTFTDYPHVGVWPDGYYMSTNNFNTAGTVFLGAGLYTMERQKMLVGDQTAKIIGFATDNTHGGMLPSNLQGLTPPPAGTPNLFGEFDADEFGAATDLVRFFSFHADYVTPANSTVTQGPDIATAAFDARTPGGRAIIQQPSPGEGLDAIADRLMHALNFRVLPGGVQSMVLNFTVNVSGVNPTTAALYQGGVRWMELRRNSGTGVVTINQQATYAPGSGSGVGRDLWMASVDQDGQGNIALAASATAPGPTPPALNPTAIYTGRLAGDPVNTLPQGEVDAMSAVTRGVQTATSSRWGDYSSLFIDPADDCTFWGAYEYVDSPTASFDWNTRVFSFKVNSACVSSQTGTITGTVTACAGGTPISGASIKTAEGYLRQSAANGTYSMTVAPGTYTVTITAPNSSVCTTNNVVVTAGGNTVVNCCLAGTAQIVAAGATLVSESCAPANGAVDPNETVTVSLCVQNTGTTNSTNLVGTLQNTGGVTGASSPQTYGVVVAGGAPVCRNFTFTASGTCGGTITASLQLQDGASNLGTITYTFTLGATASIFSQNFDGVTAPALPAGWTTSFVNGAGCALGSNWATTTTTPDTAPNAAFHNDPNCISDGFLVSPPITGITSGAKLSFRNNWNLESGFDGAVLEFTTNAGGTWTDVITGGGSFVSGGYNGTISVNFSSPIAGRMAWTGNGGGYVTTVINLPASLAGQTVQFRWREASDSSVSGTGQFVDTISISSLSCATCAAQTCSLTCPANIVKSNDPNQCGAVVTYPAPTTTGSCGTVTCSPASGSFFPKGVTTVTCSSSGGGTAPTSFPVAPADDGKSVGGTASVAVSGPKPGQPTSSVRLKGLGQIGFPASPFVVLYDQTSNPSAAATSSQNFEASFDTFDNQTADDFVVPAGQSWMVNQVNVSGVYFNGNGPVRNVNVKFYADSATLPAASALQSFSNVAVTDTAGNFSITLPSAVALTAGTYWVSVQANMDFGVGGQWGWLDRTTISNSGAAWINPGNGFGAGCSPNWGRKTTCVTGSDPDNIFQLLGTSGAVAGGGPTCSFTVTVNDTQAPTITCPANVTAITPVVGGTGVVVTYPPPTASDNCPGVTTQCTPPSGSVFGVGTTSVTCTATDTSGNTASCSFTVSVFNVSLQDESAGCNSTLLFNTVTGDYRFCCNGTVFTGKGTVKQQGSIYTLTHNPVDRRVLATVDGSTRKGNASLQSPAGTLRCTIRDDNVLNNTCLCGGAGGGAAPTEK
ncbi:MAG: HYR domain-containing protein [Blastocatellia bacterium]